MQKITYILPLLVIASLCLAPARADNTAAPAAANNTAADNSAAAADNTADSSAPDGTTPAQEQIVRALQDDISFERKKRQLSNELALEKLRAELLKVRGESAPPASPLAAPAPAAAPDEHDEPVIPAEPPSVLFVSQVAGVSRVGVSVNGQLRFVSRHETFSANGKKYRLVTAKNNRLVAKETE